jgi:hypothetical protein
MFEVLHGKWLLPGIERWMHAGGAIALIVSKIALSLIDVLNPLS